MSYRIIGGSPNKKRNRIIYADVVGGATLRTVADRYNLSPERIRQIVGRRALKIYGTFSIKELRMMHKGGGYG